MSHPALTQLSEEERLFRDAVLDFARKRIAPASPRWTRPARSTRRSPPSSSSA